MLALFCLFPGHWRGGGGRGRGWGGGGRPSTFLLPPLPPLPLPNKTRNKGETLWKSFVKHRCLFFFIVTRTYGRCIVLTCSSRPNSRQIGAKFRHGNGKIVIQCFSSMKSRRGLITIIQLSPWKAVYWYVIATEYRTVRTHILKSKSKTMHILIFTIPSCQISYSKMVAGEVFLLLFKC